MRRPAGRAHSVAAGPQPPRPAGQGFRSRHGSELRARHRGNPPAITSRTGPRQCGRAPPTTQRHGTETPDPYGRAPSAGHENPDPARAGGAAAPVPGGLGQLRPAPARVRISVVARNPVARKGSARARARFAPANRRTCAPRPGRTRRDRPAVGVVAPARACAPLDRRDVVRHRDPGPRPRSPRRPLARPATGLEAVARAAAPPPARMRASAPRRAASGGRARRRAFRPFGSSTRRSGPRRRALRPFSSSTRRSGPWRAPCACTSKRAPAR
jgi:hypothetical protein